MARYYPALLDDGRRCAICDNRTQLYGGRDPESGWVGFCSECNVRWYAHRFDSNLRVCNRHCYGVGLNLHLLLGAFGLNQQMEWIIRKCLDYCPVTLRRSIRLKHQLQVNHLLWLSAPLDWYLEATDSEAEDERYERPILRTLKEVHITSPRFVAVSFKGLHRRTFSFASLLDAISSYL